MTFARQDSENTIMKDWWDYIKIKNVYLRRLYNQIQGYTTDFKTVETYITEHYVVSKICNSYKSIRKRQNITEKWSKGIACKITPHFLNVLYLHEAALFSVGDYL